MFWGFTPALDFLEELEKVSSTSEEVNILLFGSSDCRHILKTMAHRYRRKKSIKFTFYVVENALESILKQLLLLKIAFQPQENLGPSLKTKIFMELFGNTLIRPYTARYLYSAALDLLDIVTNEEIMKERTPFIKLHLKYKERDYIENVLKFWSGSDPFNIQEIWDKRVRKHLGIRYDSKIGAFDWDLNMQLHQRGGRQICGQEYKHWRKTGVAFTWMECDFSKPNRSFVTGVIPNGNNFVHYGYLGDIQTGPYIPFGLECEEESYVKVTNHQNVHRSTDVTERNLLQIFHELEFQDDYVHHKVNDYILGPAGFQLPLDRVVNSEGNTFEKDQKLDCFVPENVTIHFVSMSKVKQMINRENFKNVFSIIYFASEYLKFFDIDLVRNVSSPNCLFLVENKIFNLNTRTEDLEKFYEDIKDVFDSVATSAASFECSKDFYAKFLMNKSI